MFTTRCSQSPYPVLKSKAGGGEHGDKTMGCVPRYLTILAFVWVGKRGGRGVRSWGIRGGREEHGGRNKWLGTLVLKGMKSLWSLFGENEMIVFGVVVMFGCVAYVGCSAVVGDVPILDSVCLP